MGNKSKRELLLDIDKEVQLITNDICAGSNIDDASAEFASNRLAKIYHSESLGRIQTLRKLDPFWADEQRKATGQTDEEMDDEFREFWLAMEKKNFYFDLDENTPNPAAAKWRRAKAANHGLADEYQKKKGFSDKAAYRQDWLKREFDKWAKRVQYKAGEINEKAESKDGQYISLAKIAVEEGGGRAGLRAAINWAHYCILLGGEMLEYCEGTKQMKYLHIVHRLTDTYKKINAKWTTWTHMDDPALPAPTAPAGGAPAALPAPEAASGEPAQEPAPSAAQPKSRASKKKTGAAAGEEAAPAGKKRKCNQGDDTGDAGKSTGDGNDGEPTGGHGKKVPTKSPAWLVEFRKVKNVYNIVTSQARTVSKSIKNDKKWAWAMAKVSDPNDPDGEPMSLNKHMNDALTE
ncbi:unnamed protein product, partial [Prorocentrum cordatum]